jgi:hypothetical protein
MVTYVYKKIHSDGKMAYVDLPKGAVVVDVQAEHLGVTSETLAFHVTYYADADNQYRYYTRRIRLLKDGEGQDLTQNHSFRDVGVVFLVSRGSTWHLVQLEVEEATWRREPQISGDPAP